MDTPRRPHRVSLFAKFTAVILLLGIVPIVLLVTVLQSRMLTEYRASLEDAYQDAIAYSAYSIRVRLDTYTDLSKFCYYYNYSSQGDFSYDYDNYDNLRKILSGEVFADADNAADSIRHEMGLFLHYMNMTDADIEASHFIYAPAGAAKVVSYQLGNYNNSLFDSEAYLQAVDFEHWDTEAAKWGLCPPTRWITSAFAARARRMSLPLGATITTLPAQSDKKNTWVRSFWTCAPMCLTGCLPH